MKKSSLIIIILITLIAAFWGVIYYLKTLHQKEMENERTQAALWEERLEATVNRNAALEAEARLVASQESQARIEAEARTAQALEAKRMAEEKARLEVAEKQDRLTRLNERLKREAEERNLAEASLRRLTEKLQELEKAQKTAQASLKQLEAVRTQLAEVGDDPLEVLTETRKVLDQKDEQIRTLRQEKDFMEKQYQVALIQQMETVQEITRESGEKKKAEWHFPLSNFLSDILHFIGLRH